jgi:hypothetical protein
LQLQRLNLVEHHNLCMIRAREWERRAGLPPFSS